MTMFMVTLRAVAAVASGHTFAYFVVPVVETSRFSGLLFLVTMFTSEPLIVRLARDFVPHLADDLAGRRRLIRSLSAVWTLTYLASGSTTLLLLVTQSIPVYVTAHELAGWGLGSQLVSAPRSCCAAGRPRACGRQRWPTGTTAALPPPCWRRRRLWLPELSAA